jgi:hypothetical protein
VANNKGTSSPASSAEWGWVNSFFPAPWRNTFRAEPEMHNWLIHKVRGIGILRSSRVKNSRRFPPARMLRGEFYRQQQTYGAEHEWETRSALGWRRVVAPDKDHKPKYTERPNGPIQSTAGDILYVTLKKLAADRRPAVPTFCSRCTTRWSWNAPRRMLEESRCGSRRRWARPWRRSWAQSLVD